MIKTRKTPYLIQQEVFEFFYDIMINKSSLRKVVECCMNKEVVAIECTFVSAGHTFVHDCEISDREVAFCRINVVDWFIWISGSRIS